MVVAEYWTVGTLNKVKWILRSPRASSTLAPPTTGNRHLISMLSEKNRDAYAFKKLLK